MKKFLVTGALALSIAALSQQQASAWTNFRVGLGLNLGWQSGGNNWLWGAFRNGQPPGPEFGGGIYGYPPGHHPHHQHMPFYFGHGMPSNGHAMPSNGHGMPLGGYGAPFQGMSFEPPMPAPVFAPMETQAFYPHGPAYHGAYYYPVNWYR